MGPITLSMKDIASELYQNPPRLAAWIGKTFRPITHEGWLGNTYNYFTLGHLPAIKRALGEKDGNFPDLARLAIGHEPWIVAVMSPKNIKKLISLNRDGEECSGGRNFAITKGTLGTNTPLTHPQLEVKRELRKLGASNHFGIKGLKNLGEDIRLVFDMLPDLLKEGPCNFSEATMALANAGVRRVLLERDEIPGDITKAIRSEEKRICDDIFWNLDAFIPGFVPTKANRDFHEGRSIMEQIIKALLDDPTGMTSHILEHFNNKQEAKDYICMILFIGASTTRSAMESIAYFLIRNPEYQTLVRQEIAGIEDNRSLADALAKTIVLNAVIDETLRLKPPVMAQGRKLKQDMWFGEEWVEAGTTVYAVHYYGNRNKRYWGEDACAWHPSRHYEMQDGKLAKRKDLPSFFPFSHRNTFCMGKHYAETFLQHYVYFLVKDYELLPPETPQKLKSIGGITHKFTEDVQGIVRKRYSTV